MLITQIIKRMELNIETLVLTSLSAKDLRFLFRSEIEKYFVDNPLNYNNISPSEEAKKLLSIQEAATLLNLKVESIYRLTSKREIPFMKKNKRLYFDREELLKFIRSGRQKTVSEIEAAAEDKTGKLGANRKAAKT